MSAYRAIASKIKCQESIIDALIDRVVQLRRARLGETRFASERDEIIADARQLVAKAVECYEAPVNLFGYQGDMRKQTAHVVARADFVNLHLGGGASNDLGFLRRDDGTFEAIVSDYDSNRWWNNAAPRFWQAAAAHSAERDALAEGYQLHRSEVDGNIRLEVVMAGSSNGAGW